MYMPNYVCDLHLHTNRSDGADTPCELIDQAAELGMKVIAITDHDIRPPEAIAVDGIHMDISEYAGSKGLILLKGIEVSCETEIEDVHIVCFGCDWSNLFFDDLEASVSRSKIEGYKLLLEALGGMGMRLDWKEILAAYGIEGQESAIQKKMIFEQIARKGYAASWQDAKIMVKEEPKLQIKRCKPAALEVITAVSRMGGISILAHPYLIAEQVAFENASISRAELIDRLILAGLCGIEANYTYDKTSYTGSLGKEEIAHSIVDAYSNRLAIISGGSDYHADHKKGVGNPRRIGEAGIEFDYFQANALLTVAGGR